MVARLGWRDVEYWNAECMLLVFLATCCGVRRDIDVLTPTGISDYPGATAENKKGALKLRARICYARWVGLTGLFSLLWARCHCQ